MRIALLLFLLLAGCSDPQPIMFMASDYSNGAFNVRDHVCVRADGKPIEWGHFFSKDGPLYPGNSYEYDCTERK